MRVATWNMKQAVAPKRPLGELWAWAERRLAPDVMVLTEARVPKAGPPAGWSAVWEPDGIGPRRRWGTAIAGRGVELRPVVDVRTRRGRYSIQPDDRAAVQVCEVHTSEGIWGVVAGVYGLTIDEHGTSVKHGRRYVPLVMQRLAPLFDAYPRVVVAGDLNLWPAHKPRVFDDLGLVDLVEHTATSRPALRGCSGCNMGAACGHLWTHRNGNGPNATVQQIDYVFATHALLGEVASVRGGAVDFPDAWDVSDHAPVVVDFGPAPGTGSPARSGRRWFGRPRV